MGGGGGVLKVVCAVWEKEIAASLPARHTVCVLLCSGHNVLRVKLNHWPS